MQTFGCHTHALVACNRPRFWGFSHVRPHFRGFSHIKKADQERDGDQATGVGPDADQIAPPERGTIICIG